MTFEVAFDGQVRTHGEHKLLSESDFEEFIGSSFSVLASSHGVKQAKYTASPSEGTVQITIGVDADTAAEALLAGSAAIQSAFHAADAHTPGWTIDWCTVRLSGHNVLEMA